MVSRFFAQTEQEASRQILEIMKILVSCNHCRCRLIQIDQCCESFYSASQKYSGPQSPPIKVQLIRLGQEIMNTPKRCFP